MFFMFGHRATERQATLIIVKKQIFHGNPKLWVENKEVCIYYSDYYLRFICDLLMRVFILY